MGWRASPDCRSTRPARASRSRRRRRALRGDDGLIWCDARCAAQLVLKSGPGSSVTAGVAFGLTVAVEDAYGNVETGYGGDLRVGLVGGPAGAALGGVVDEPAVGGLATFSGLALTRAGSGYEIEASGGSLTDALFGPVRGGSGLAGSARRHAAAVAGRDRRDPPSISECRSRMHSATSFPIPCGCLSRTCWAAHPVRLSAAQRRPPRRAVWPHSTT